MELGNADATPFIRKGYLSVISLGCWSAIVLFVDRVYSKQGLVGTDFEV